MAKDIRPQTLPLPRIMRRFLLLLGFVLCLIALWIMWTAFPAQELTVTPGNIVTPTTTVSPPSSAKIETSPTPRKPLKITSKGKVRLKPGESAVLGYWKIAPGMNGMAIVTPETTPEGHVKMVAKLVQMSDIAVADADANDLFPDLFDFENYSAISAQRLRDLTSALQDSRGTDLLMAPTLLTLPGQKSSISIGHSDGDELSLGLQADPVAETGGYDLSLELQRQE